MAAPRDESFTPKERATQLLYDKHRVDYSRFYNEARLLPGGPVRASEKAMVLLRNAYKAEYHCLKFLIAPPRGHAGGMTLAKQAAIRLLYKAGYGVTLLARVGHVNQHAVRAVIVQAGIPLRGRGEHVRRRALSSTEV
ncbi:hypothetical protein FDA94_28640 [Herbidospora galbida]|uniref:Uncharacterized protein n=1 Tax=Herbidospora galbida TaxID=2575442 RepID=A0A4U3M7T4_9ACTN|nr:hypothetical protein [Herbidospora galbida]TKK84600.1 hypothetical protein FDA94_28640 [Herbidospora galbida]